MPMARNKHARRSGSRSSHSENDLEMYQTLHVQGIVSTMQLWYKTSWQTAVCGYPHRWFPSPVGYPYTGTLVVMGVYLGSFRILQTCMAFLAWHVHVRTPH